MRKSSDPTPNYRSGGSRSPVSLATFRDQMADYARAEQLRELRAVTHHSQEYVAHEIGVSVKSVRTWENGGKIRWENAKKLAAFYGVEPEGLVSRDLSDEPPVASNGVSQLDRIETMLKRVLTLLDDDAELAAADRELQDLEAEAGDAKGGRGGAKAAPKKSRKAS